MKFEQGNGFRLLRREGHSKPNPTSQRASRQSFRCRNRELVIGLIPAHRTALMLSLAEADEGCIGTLELGLATFKPVIPPFPFKVIHVIARRHDPRVVIGFRVKDWENRFL